MFPKYPNQNEAFQITKSALKILLYKESEARFEGKLPTAAFQWTYHQLSRSIVINEAIDLQALRHWGDACKALNLVPVFLYADENLTEDELEYLEDIGIVCHWISSHNFLKVGRGEKVGKDDYELAPLSTRIMMPDEAVVCRYIGRQDKIPKNAWKVVDDLEFWFVYGKAMTSWKTKTTEVRWKQLDIELREQIANKYEFGVQNVSFGSEEMLHVELNDGGTVAYSKDFPFIHDVRKGTTVTKYGRLSLFDVSLDDATAVKNPLKPTLSFLKRLAENLRMALVPEDKLVWGASSTLDEGSSMNLIVINDSDNSDEKLVCGTLIGSVHFGISKDANENPQKKLVVKISSFPIDVEEVEVIVEFPNAGLRSRPMSYFRKGILGLIDITAEFTKTDRPELLENGKDLQIIYITIGDRELECAIS